jgi:hypothetical protein
MDSWSLLLSEMGAAEIADYFISGRSEEIVISTFGKRNWAGRRYE